MEGGNPVRLSKGVNTENKELRSKDQDPLLKEVKMGNARIFVLAGVILAISSCSTESLKRTGYETLQNIQETQCQKYLSADCSERESYDTYRRRMEDNEAG